MATLTVTTTTNYTGTVLSDIDRLVFATSGPATATFASSQFGPTLIHPALVVQGDGFANSIVVNMVSNAFSAIQWTFSNWAQGANANDVITINGTGGADTIDGSIRNDVINGGAGNDTINAGGGFDTIFGGAGDDNIRGMAGNDIINGGAGIDEARYDRDEFGTVPGTAAVTVNLATGIAVDGFGHTDTLISIEAVRGTRFNDTLIGGHAANSAFEGFRGLAGNDTINGGVGYDEVRHDLDAVNGGTAGVTVNLAAGTAVDGFGNTDTLIAIEGARGTAQNDSFTGNAVNNTFTGLAGTDTYVGGDGFDTLRFDLDAQFGGSGAVSVNLQTGAVRDGFGNIETATGFEGAYGTAGNDVLIGRSHVGFYGDGFWGGAGADTIDGSAGFDEVRYDRDAAAGGAGGVIVNLTTGVARDGFGHTDTLIAIENVRGTNQADVLIGTAFLNTFRGLGGNDIFDGVGGDDTVAYDFDADNGGTAGVTVNLAAGTAIDGFGDTDTLRSIENARGTNVADTLIGSAGNNDLMGLGGNDTIDGGGGFDEVRYDVDWARGGGAGVTVNLATGTATDGFGHTDTLISIEAVRATRFNDTLIGGNGDEMFRGLAGNDTINGGGGIDWVGYGLDIFAREESETLTGVTVNLLAGTATDSFGGTDTLIGIENVAGGNLNDSLTGNDGDNVFRGRGGNDTINGLGGIDTVDYSDDAYYGQVTFTNGSNAVSVNLAAGTAADAFGHADTLISIENVIGTAFNDTIIGSAVANVLHGGAGHDVLDGGGLNDTLVGGEGNDTYFVDHAADQVIEAAGGGTDTVYASTNWVLGAGQEVEVLGVAGGTGGTNSVYLTANEFNQTLHGNNGVNLLNGAGGADIMIGYGGQDTYYVDTQADQVIEAAGGGTDRIFCLTSYTLRPGTVVEILQTRGVSTTDTINMTGNGYNQTIYGNAGANVINGGNGNDELWGFAGNDTFLFDTALNEAINVDTIVDFFVPQDTIALARSIFSSLGSAGVLNAEFLRIGAAAQDANDYIIYNSATGALSYDADGSGAGAAIRFAQLSTGLALTNADFLVV